MIHGFGGGVVAIPADRKRVFVVVGLLRAAGSGEVGLRGLKP